MQLISLLLIFIFFTLAISVISVAPDDLCEIKDNPLEPFDPPEEYQQIVKDLP